MNPEILKAMGKYGPVTVGFFYLLWMLSTSWTLKLTLIETNLRKINSNQIESISVLESIDEELKDSNRMTRRRLGLNE